MKRVGGILVFAAASFLGICGAWIEAKVASYPIVPEIEAAGRDLHETKIVPGPKGIQVMYAGICSVARDGGRVYLKFLIHNNTKQPLVYIGDFANHKANGTLLPSALICSKGSREFTIPPGRSAEVLVDREEFLTRQ